MTVRFTGTVLSLRVPPVGQLLCPVKYCVLISTRNSLAPFPPPALAALALVSVVTPLR